jgi:glutamate-1-semialdehyde 2,1-aminomutase
MEKTRSWETISKTGENIRARWQKLADTYGLPIEHWGLPALTGFTFKSVNELIYKTFITQEMLKKGYLAGNCVYISTAHTPEIVDKFFEDLAPIFAAIQLYSSQNQIDALLNGPVCHGGFKRLN